MDTGLVGEDLKDILPDSGIHMDRPNNLNIRPCFNKRLESSANPPQRLAQILTTMGSDKQNPSIRVVNGCKVRTGKLIRD